jgi:hypothetical protein
VIKEGSVRLEKLEDESNVIVQSYNSPVDDKEVFDATFEKQVKDFLLERKRRRQINDTQRDNY